MRIEDLQSILAYCTTDTKERIVVTITHSNGAKERCDIQSFDAFYDGVSLNVKSEKEE